MAPAPAQRQGRGEVRLAIGRFAKEHLLLSDAEEDHLEHAIYPLALAETGELDRIRSGWPYGPRSGREGSRTTSSPTAMRPGSTVEP